MEEKEKVSTETKKKKGSKDAEAKAKVELLLKNTIVANLVTKPVEEVNNDLDISAIKKEKSMDWMEQQVNDLTEQVESLENEILFYKEELQKLQNGGVVDQQQNAMVDNSLNQNVVALFRHFENVYEQQGGEPMIRVAHPESGHGILDKFLEYLPQLNAVKRYRYRGTRMF